MKKMFLVIMAAVLAIGFSAFTSSSKILDGFYYQDGPNQVLVNPELVEDECPEGDTEKCILFLNGDYRQILYPNGTQVWREPQH